MTEISMALLELLRKHGLETDVDVLREGIRMVSLRRQIAESVSA